MTNQIYEVGNKVVGTCDRIIYIIKEITYARVVLESMEDKRELIIGASAVIHFRPLK